MHFHVQFICVYNNIHVFLMFNHWGNIISPFTGDRGGKKKMQFVRLKHLKLCRRISMFITERNIMTLISLFSIFSQNFKIRDDTVYLMWIAGHFSSHHKRLCTHNCSTVRDVVEAQAWRYQYNFKSYEQNCDWLGLNKRWKIGLLFSIKPDLFIKTMIYAQINY